MSIYQINIDENYAVPEGKFLDSEAYVNFVMNKAAESYKKQYDTSTLEEAIFAALTAYNISLSYPIQE